MHKGLLKQARELRIQTGAPESECIAFMEDFERFLHFLSSYFGVKQSKIATRVFLDCRRQARFEQLDGMGLSEEEARAIEAIDIGKPTAPNNVGVSDRELAAIFGGAERN